MNPESEQFRSVLVRLLEFRRKEMLEEGVYWGKILSSMRSVRHLWPLDSGAGLGQSELVRLKEEWETIKELMSTEVLDQDAILKYFSSRLGQIPTDFARLQQRFSDSLYLLDTERGKCLQNKKLDLEVETKILRKLINIMK